MKPEIDSKLGQIRQEIQGVDWDITEAGGYVEQVEVPVLEGESNEVLQDRLSWAHRIWSLNVNEVDNFLIRKIEEINQLIGSGQCAEDDLEEKHRELESLREALSENTTYWKNYIKTIKCVFWERQEQPISRENNLIETKLQEASLQKKELYEMLVRNNEQTQIDFKSRLYDRFASLIDMPSLENFCNEFNIKMNKNLKSYEEQYKVLGKGIKDHLNKNRMLQAKLRVKKRGEREFYEATGIVFIPFTLFEEFEDEKNLFFRKFLDNYEDCKAKTQEEIIAKIEQIIRLQSQQPPRERETELTADSQNVAPEFPLPESATDLSAILGK
ncbi:MAG: hypothetical protein LBJ09_01100 [Clostridiales bacterium]|jgi:hypothetical protein|nr:hypothetical protein [Clostridiales bacterium]